mmetsp:Transcript_15780/g.13805  ORF Transcript_15780/g.13805 Transcript_15780/m.13805 type:complete len:116 (+) Transcript_15780:531-878(+)
MSEAEFLGETLPAPNKYKINESLVTKRLVGMKLIHPKTKYSWKPVKVKGPDSGSYDYQIGLDKSSRMKNTISNLFSKSKRPQLHKSKGKTTPGVGTYKLEKVYDKISRPMKSSRR